MLFESCLIATTLAFANPADPSGKTMYPSGNNDCDKIIFSAPPISAYPLLTIGSPVNLEDGTVIEIGNYSIKPSIDETQIFIIQGHKTICECQVIENTIVSDFAAKPTAKISRIENNLILTYRIENILKRAIVPVTKGY